MNSSLVDKILGLDDGIVATVLGTEGHTYKKKGEKALFKRGDPIPVHGNLGSLCVDRDIVERGEKAFAGKAPAILEVDTTDAADIHFGYGTYCGGRMEILLEPVFEAQKRVYRELRSHLERNEPVYLAHDLRTGELSIFRIEPERREQIFVEWFPASPKLFIFGATPLAHCVAAYLDPLQFDVHIIDWRDRYLDAFRNMPRIELHKESGPFDDSSLVLIVSHSFEWDKRTLKEALSKKCAFIGLLSSRTRRDRMFEELFDEGIPRGELDRVSCPVGIDIGGRSDPEIAISIVAEIVRFKNR